MTSRLSVLILTVGLLISCSEKKEEVTNSDSSSGAIGKQPSLPEGALEAAPLERAESATSDVLFEKLGPEATGLDFVHLWQPGSAHEELLQKTGFTGGGVALGDYDADGLCDVYLTRPHGGGRLYRNLGGFKFQDATEAAGLKTEDSWCTGASFIDVNNDGLLDLYVCAYASENRLFLNRGEGRFEDRARASGLSFMGANVKMAFADYDLDGDLDAYLVTNRREPIGEPEVEYEGSPGNYTVKESYRELVGVINLPDGEQKFTKAGQYDHLFKNLLVETGELRFADVSRAVGIEGADHGLDATWWDYDADGYPDLYVSNDFTDPDKFYRNRGDGTFEDILGEALPHTPWFTMGSATGDLNNDGLLDLVAADMSATSHYREKISMGAMDAVAWFLDTAEPRQYMRNAVYLNTGTERFMEIAHLTGLASSNWTWSLKMADLDEDGREDVFATNGFPFDYLNSDFAAELAKTGQASDPSAWREAPRLPEENIAFRNDGDYRFHKAGPAWGLDELAISFGAGLGDLDGDGDLDLVVNNFASAPSVYRNQSTRNSRIKIRLRGTRSNRSGLGAMVRVTTDADQHVRFINGGGGFMSADEPGVSSIGLGSQRIVAQLSVRWPSGAIQVFHDLASDHLYTITEPTLVPEPAAPNPEKAPLFERSDLLAAARHVERPFDDFALQPLLPNKLSQLGPSMAWGDLDGDGREDFFLGGAAGQAGQVFVRTKSGKFARLEAEAGLEADRGCEDMGCVFLDADGDGDLDLYVASGGVEAPVGDVRYRDRLYLNQGEGATPRFAKSEEAVPDLRDSSGPVAVADFDRDGDLDLFVGGRVVPGAYPTSPISRLLKNEGGKFLPAGDPLSIGMVTAALWADVDGDSWSDLLVTTEYGPVRCFDNAEGTLAERADSGLGELLGWWNGIAGADVDGDGDLDFAVTNFGQNTKYHPSSGKPQVIYHGDLAASGTKNLVEAKLDDGGGLLPVRGKSCSTSAMPHLQQKFATFHQFASASLNEIYPADILAGCLRLEANTLESGILLNDGSGKFTFRPLPRMAQAAPGFGVVFLDVDGDPHPDLFIAQNFFGPQRETGRMDGGLSILLRGDGKGNFLPVSPAESGIVIPGDATDAKTIDLNGDGVLDLVVATNGGGVEVLISREK